MEIPPDMPEACKLCQGMCCTEVHGKLEWKSEDVRRWIAGFRGATIKGDTLILHTRCSKLDDQGLCTEYEKRPQVCRRFEVGNKNCIDVVKRRAPPEKVPLILEALAREK